MNQHGKTRHIGFQDIVGCDQPPAVIQAWVNVKFGSSKNRKVNWFSKRGVFAVKRHPHNDRGDESSIQARALGVWDIGVLHDLRGPPHLVQIDDAMIDDEFEGATCATLSEGWTDVKTIGLLHQVSRGLTTSMT